MTYIPRNFQDSFNYLQAFISLIKNYSSMKKITTLLFLGLFLSLSILAQKIEITPQYGYHLNSKAHYYQGTISVKDNPTYGLTIGVPLAYNLYGEFSYSRSDSKADFFATRPDYTDDSFEMASNYFMLSGAKQVGTDKVAGFGGLQLGAAWFDSKTSRINDVWRFAVGLGAGAKLYLNDRIGIRLQGRLLLPIYFTGGGMYCGVGGGGSSCGVGVSSTSTIVQGDFTAGLIFQLGEDY
jgi:hypothetical protein